MEFQRERRVNCRRMHRCFGCDGKIEQGQQATYCCGKDDGEFWSHYECDNCRRLVFSLAHAELSHGADWLDAWVAVEELWELSPSTAESVKLLDGTEADWKRAIDEVMDRRTKGVAHGTEN